MQDTSSSHKQPPLKYPEVATALFEEKYKEGQLTSLELRVWFISTWLYILLLLYQELYHEHTFGK